MNSIDINEDKDTTEWQSTSQVFPMFFPNGCRVEPHRFHCSVCQHPIEQSAIKHHIVRMHQGHTAVIRMKGYCKRCHHTLEHRHRIKCHENTVCFEFVYEGKWVSILPERCFLRTITQWMTDAFYGKKQGLNKKVS